MKRLKNMLFSMELTGMLLIIFAISIGFATFIENDFGTITAKAKIYNAWWFELLLLLLAINMTGSIFKHKMYLKHKWAILLFHVAFLIIFIGAAITRYIGYEGMMNIREGKASNEFFSDETYLQMWASDGAVESYKEDALLASPVVVKGHDNRMKVGNRNVEIEVLDYYTNAAETFVEGPNGEELIWLVVSTGNGGRQNLYVAENEVENFGGYSFSFNRDFSGPGIKFSSDDGSLYFISADSVGFTNMMAGITNVLAPDSLQMFMSRALYKIGDVSIVLKQYYESAVRQLISTDGKEGMNHMDALLTQVSVDGKTKTINVFGGKGFVGEMAETEIDGVKVKVAFGAKKLKLPFYIKLEDFQLERYPGSNSPSSYASEVVVIDESKGLNMPYRIYMNNVLNYRGYRFFQSSYDRDELGTVLSVNHDAMGTIITYIGYLLLALGFIATIFLPHSRFKNLAKMSARIRETRKAGNAVMLILGMLLLAPSVSEAQQQFTGSQIPEINEQHAEHFGRLLMQDIDGRIKPVNTMASEVMRKLARKTTFEGQTPEQVFLGIMVYPNIWESVPIIKVAHPEVADLLGVDGKFASFDQIVDIRGTGGYRLGEYVERAYAKKPAEQSKFDKEVMKVDERVNIFYMVYSGTFLSAFPVPNDENHKWVTSASASKFKDEDESLFVKGILSMYFQEVAKGVQSGDYSSANEHLEYIHQFQEKYGAEVMPSEAKIDLEILYNKINIFDRLSKYYGIVGLILLILNFINILKPKINLRVVTIIASVLVIVLFLVHTAGLIIRWNISGHAPWSNGYESLIYIAWATSLAGLIFVWRSQITLAVTALLSSLILTVAHMAWMDPEITTLVPVLKSYWLIIHVAIITSSYGFLALGALMGFINLLLMIMKTKKNVLNLNMTITEFTYVIEMTLIVGLFMLTIGTFLGGVWANESWGR
ncbi:MAG: cytochrome c biogenesis protein ResB, partial [Bacteroidales bacterium]|nr:cytochrome c biogenesis protein ResB [Bacteroidales bacterium]